MPESPVTIHVRLSIDVVSIRTESNQLVPLSVSTRALLQRLSLEWGSLFRNALRSALEEKYDVKSSTHIALPGKVAVTVGDDIETSGVQ